MIISHFGIVKKKIDELEKEVEKNTVSLLKYSRDHRGKTKPKQAQLKIFPNTLIIKLFGTSAC